MDDTLLAAYRAAVYEARLPGGRRCSIALDAELALPLLHWLGDSPLCALVTAWNPRSQACDATTNRRAQRSLRLWLDRAGLRWLPGVGRSAQAPRWREASLLVAAPKLELIDTLALRHAQNAVVLAHRHGHTHLRIYTPHDARNV